MSPRPRGKVLSAVKNPFVIIPILLYLIHSKNGIMNTDVNRRQFIGILGAGITSIMPGIIAAQSAKRHIITLSFDDGFKKSSVLTATIFEKYKLSACINVVATGHLPDFKSPDEYQVTEKGDFGLWNELKSSGHEIMPHGYKHARKTTMPLTRCPKSHCGLSRIFFKKPERI